MDTLLTMPDFNVGSGDPDSLDQASSLYAESSLSILFIEFLSYSQVYSKMQMTSILYYKPLP